MDWAPLTELIFPSRCLGCGVLGISICTRCRPQWNPHIYRKAIEGLTIYSSIHYSSVAQKVVLAAKEGGLHQADQLVVEALLRSLTYFRKERGEGVLVPIPSRKDAVRKRGRSFIEVITSEIDYPFSHSLSISRRIRDHSTLSHDQRFKNINGAFSANHYVSGDVILIDDIVTSGSTLLEARRAFRRRGIKVKGAITACMA